MVVHHFSSRPPPAMVMAYSQLRRCTTVLQTVSVHATTDDRVCYKGGNGELWRPSHSGGDHSPTVVTTARRWCCNQFGFCYNQPHFLLLLSSDFAGNHPFFATDVLILLQQVFGFASTVSCFCWNRCFMLLVPPCASFLLEPMPRFLFLLPWCVCFAGIGTGFCYHHLCGCKRRGYAIFNATTGDQDGRLHRSCVTAPELRRRHGALQPREQAAACTKTAMATDSDDGNRRRGQRWPENMRAVLRGRGSRAVLV